MKYLVIVESPAKGKTIEKYLGKDYTVRASFGHIRDLEKKDLGIDIQNGFQPTYIISEDKKKQVTELKKIAKQSDAIILATDPDREGEAIAWHLCEVLGIDPKEASRVTYHEITKNAIISAFQTPGKIDLNLVNAQQARRILDRLVGFKVSPVLWQKIKTGLSAGRVQSVAVKLIVEREREIQAFIPEESWKLLAKLEHDTLPFNIEFTKNQGKNKKLKTQKDLLSILETFGCKIEDLHFTKNKKGFEILQLPLQTNFELKTKEKKESTRMPGAPFTTSTLQQEASRKLGYGVSQTMSIAQNLYQNGYITYMRTDSVSLSDSAMSSAKEYIESHYGKEYSLANGRKYKNKQANAQEAHEAIRPAYMEKSPDSIDLDGQDLRLYKLIWERTIASQMKEAEIETTTYSFEPKSSPGQIWIAKGEVITFPGFMKLYVEGVDDEGEESSDSKLPLLDEKCILPSSQFQAEQLFSRPPARYTEAALVKKLENEGIGRPSTYAPTITTIIERGYVERVEKKLQPTDIAFTVNDYLEKAFNEMMDYKFTAKVEEEFDAISLGKIEWREMLGTFYTRFEAELIKAVGEKGKVQEKLGRKCPKCEEGELVYKYGKSGKFIACNRYPECDFVENQKDERIEKLKELYEGKPCEAGGTLVVKTGRFGPFLASSLYPEIKWIGKIPDPKIQALEEKFGGGSCEKCETGIMHVKSSRRGPFLACSNYPECKNAQPLPKNQEVAGDDSSE